MAALVLSALVLVLSGCVFTKPEATLYRLPKLKGEYESPESQIDARAFKRREYAAPPWQQSAKRADDRFRR